MKYNRMKAVEYAQKWALSRNPIYYNYDKIGGDCTNFISQCIYAGIGEMNYNEYGWYYRNANNKAASWTGVEYLYKFLISNKAVGPKGEVISRNDVELGDLIQLSFDGIKFRHTLIVTRIENNELYVCTHTQDALNIVINTYNYEKIRYIKVS